MKVKLINFSNGANITYNPGDCDDYYLAESQVETGIKHIKTIFELDEKLALTIEFIKFHEKLKRDRLIHSETVDISSLLLEKNKIYRRKFGDWVHRNNAIYDEFYDFINGGANES